MLRSDTLEFAVLCALGFKSWEVHSASRHGKCTRSMCAIAPTRGELCRVRAAVRAAALKLRLPTSRSMAACAAASRPSPGPASGRIRRANPSWHTLVIRTTCAQHAAAESLSTCARVHDEQGSGRGHTGACGVRLPALAVRGGRLCRGDPVRPTKTHLYIWDPT